MDLYGVTPYLDRAKALIARGDDAALRYAALELRCALETVAFRQLKEYGKEFPGTLVGEWKADRVLKILASFDPQSDVAGDISYALVETEDEKPTDWKPIGSTQSIGWKVFRGHYNKLGSYLHVPTPKSEGAKAPKPLPAASLSNIIESLELFAKATVIAAMKSFVSSICICGNTVYAGQSEFDNGDIVVCGNRKCNAIYNKVRADDGSEILERIRVISFPCVKCEGRIPVLPAEVWAVAKCPECSTTYRLNLAFTTAVPAPQSPATDIDPD